MIGTKVLCDPAEIASGKIGFDGSIAYSFIYRGNITGSMCNREWLATAPDRWISIFQATATKAERLTAGVHVADATSVAQVPPVGAVVLCTAPVVAAGTSVEKPTIVVVEVAGCMQLQQACVGLIIVVPTTVCIGIRPFGAGRESPAGA